jgi:RNA polymerase sigma-70 factor (family 1)
MCSLSESNLIKKVRKGDKKAFRVIYDRYHKSLFLIARQFLKDRHMAEDAVQDIFIKLWLTKEGLDPEKSIKSFLFTCLKNHVLNMIRNQKRRILAAYELKECHHPISNCTEDGMQYSEYRQILKSGIDEMPEKRREIFRLKMNDGLTNDQIAQKLEISINTVKVHYQLGSKFIKSYLKDQADVSFHI